MPITIRPPATNKWEDNLRRFVEKDLGKGIYSTSVAEKMAIAQVKANAAAKWLEEVMREGGPSWR